MRPAQLLGQGRRMNIASYPSVCDHGLMTTSVAELRQDFHTESFWLLEHSVYCEFPIAAHAARFSFKGAT